jgi:hypothetical protein
VAGSRDIAAHPSAAELFFLWKAATKRGERFVAFATVTLSALIAICDDSTAGGVMWAT